MITKSDLLKFFGVLQAGILVGIAVAVWLFRKRQKERERAAGMDPEALIVRPISRGPTGPQTDLSSQSPLPKAPQLESAFPSWSTETLPHIILGIAATSDAEEIERAYKSLLKEYHPDRFASWGAGYQKRAHRTILLLQEAKEKMLKKS